MEPVKRDPKSMLPLTPAMFHILLTLADGDERHGYSIMQEIKAQTEGKVIIGPTTLYRSLRQMVEHGMIVETAERPDPALDDERRRYYRLTHFGRQVTLAEKLRLMQLLAIAEKKKALSSELPGSPAYGGAS
jgi:DNA-binding PadR family transcriptional regulator